MSRTPPNPSGWLWALGTATIVTAARWREITLHGGEIPFLDPWLVEARQIILPWLDGTLHPADFFIPHHEHLPIWTRLLAWLEVVIGGQWNSQFQATINAMLTGTFVGTICIWLRRELPIIPALLLSGLTVILYSLPHSFENIVWGFQAHMPLALLFVGLHLRGSFAHTTGTAGWWCAQLAGLAALGTLGSMWAAPLAVLVVLGWTHRRGWLNYAAAAFLTGLGLTLLLYARSLQPHTGAYAQAPVNLPQFLAALLGQLGWPSAWAGAALLLSLPAFLLALRVRGRNETSALDATILAMALWAVAQAVAFAYARGSYAGFVSRYGDLLAVGIVANAMALWRLITTSGWTGRLGVCLMTIGWAAAVGYGLQTINTEGHTKYFHEHSAAWARVRSAAVRQYLATKDPAHLSGQNERGLLFPDPMLVKTVLDHPRMAALLAAEVQPADASSPRARLLRNFCRDLRSWWLELAWSGGLLLLAGACLTRQDTRQISAALTPRSLLETSHLVLMGGLAAGSFLLLFLWPRPFEYRTERRWDPLLSPPGTVADLSFHIVTETTYPKDNLTGGAALWPEDFRNRFFGTHIDGPAFIGVAESTVFSLQAPWYVAPFAGYPASAGNNLSLRIENEGGQVLTDIACPGPNPGPGQTDIGFWVIDAQKYQGQRGRFIISDQRTDAEGWIAIAPPHPSPDGSNEAGRLKREWAAEGSLSGLRSLQVIALALGSWFVALAAMCWRRHRNNPTA